VEEKEEAKTQVWKKKSKKKSSNNYIWNECKYAVIVLCAIRHFLWEHSQILKVAVPFVQGMVESVLDGILR
jgi:hypothetical protein